VLAGRALEERAEVAQRDALQLLLRRHRQALDVVGADALDRDLVELPDVAEAHDREHLRVPHNYSPQEFEMALVGASTAALRQ
jgi:hypothetical protein